MAPLLDSLTKTLGELNPFNNTDKMVPSVMKPPSPPASPTPKVIDIRSNKHELSLKDAIIKEFTTKNPQTGERGLPTMLLYDAQGLKLFEEITYLDEYYLTGAEIAVLEKWAGNMAERIEDGSVVVELGSGYVLPESG